MSPTICHSDRRGCGLALPVSRGRALQMWSLPEPDSHVCQPLSCAATQVANGAQRLAVPSSDLAIWLRRRNLECRRVCVRMRTHGLAFELGQRAARWWGVLRRRFRRMQPTSRPDQPRCAAGGDAEQQRIAATSELVRLGANVFGNCSLFTRSYQ